MIYCPCYDNGFVCFAHLETKGNIFRAGYILKKLLGTQSNHKVHKMFTFSDMVVSSKLL